MPEPRQTDVLLVSPGTTAGWRRADDELRRALEELGLDVATCTSEYRIARHLRRGVLMTDLAEAAAMRLALARALRRWRPRAIVYSSPQATMLQPRSRLAGATAARYDAPAAINRTGTGARLLHALERRSLGAVRLLLPAAAAPRPEAQAALGVSTPAVALPFPVELDGEGADAADREQFALVYAANPDKKGLDIAVAAWGAAAAPGWRLLVTGIDREAGRRFLRRRGVAEPAGIEWAGFVERERYRDLLGRASAFVAASRYEDYGIAQLEALAAGTPLVTVPSRGPYEPLRLARKLEPNLVASDSSAPALAATLAVALGLDAATRDAYRRQARELLRPYSRASLKERLRDEVLPVLLG